mmetsp:Transcript_73688/g.239981  ORF Transcript_73688/g.239981 Transcript_73688/m.239981 type:complete len:216 (+) Transcript_73688:1238-1885(+)
MLRCDARRQCVAHGCPAEGAYTTGGSGHAAASAAGPSGSHAPGLWPGPYGLCGGAGGTPARHHATAPCRGGVSAGASARQRLGDARRRPPRRGRPARRRRGPHGAGHGERQLAHQRPRPARREDGGRALLEDGAWCRRPAYKCFRPPHRVRRDQRGCRQVRSSTAAIAPAIEAEAGLASERNHRHDEGLHRWHERGRLVCEVPRQRGLGPEAGAM